MLLAIDGADPVHADSVTQALTIGGMPRAPDHVRVEWAAGCSDGRDLVVFCRGPTRVTKHARYGRRRCGR